MDTKERILQSALALYNEKGTGITSRHIAANIGISPGNLHYHFKHSDDIVKALYNRLATKMDQLVSQLAATAAINFDIISEFSSQTFELVYQYRFIFLHFVEIAGRIPAIQNHYMKLTKRRTKEFLNIFHQLINNGTLRSDLPDSVWSALVKHIFIVGDFWLSNNELTNKLKGNKAISYYKELLFMIFLPYLAENDKLGITI